MKNKKVLVFSNHLKPESVSELSNQFEVKFPKNDKFTLEEIYELLPHYDAIVPVGYKVDKAMLDIAAGHVKLIANFGAGYNNIDVDYATRLGIVVTNTPSPVIEPTAEHTLALILTVSRHITQYDKQLRQPNTNPWYSHRQPSQNISGKTLGIIGMGRIGQSVARRARACGMNIIYHNRHRLAPEIEESYQAQRVELDRLIATADIISINVPLSAETHHLINREHFLEMKPEAIVINTARGPIINERDLVEALQKKWIAAAGLDVFEQEPIISPELLLMDNVVLTPHSAVADMETYNAICRNIEQNIIGFFEGSTDIDRVTL